jgi:hypothetical protein
MTALKKFIILALPIVCYLLLKYAVPLFIPDWLGLNSIKPDDYFGLILNLTASVLGVLIAVVLLMFQLNKDNFLRRKGESFMDKPMIFSVMVLSLSIILLGFLSYITIPNFQSGSALTLGYFIGFQFAGFILLIFPAIKDILDELNTLKITIERIQRVESSHFLLDQFQTIDYQTLGADHPLSRIRHDLILSVRDGDYEAYTAILVQLNILAAGLYGNAQDRRLTDGILKGLTYIWKESFLEASRNNIQQFFKSLWETIGQLYQDAAEKKAPLLHFQEIDMFISDLLEFLARNNLADALNEANWTLSQAFEKNIIGNCPAQELISDLYYRFDHPDPNPHHSDASLQWDYLMHFIRHLNRIQYFAKENKDKELLQHARFHLNAILNDLAYEVYGNLGVYQIGYIALDIIWHQSTISKDVIEEGLYNSLQPCYEINTTFLSFVVKNQYFFIQHLMGAIADLIILSQRNGSLDSYNILMFGAIGRHASGMYQDNPMAKKTIDYVVRTFSKMKEDIETDQLPGQNVNYLAIKKEIESQKTFLLQKYPALQDPIIEKISSMVASFRETEDNQQHDLIKWEETLNS